VQPPVILIHADTANRMLLQEIRAFRAPDAFVIGRLFKDLHTQRALLESGDPAANGRAMADEILNYDFGLATQRGSTGRLLIDAWMSLNEAVPGPASRQFAEQPEPTARLLRAYDAFQVAFRARLQEAGVEAVAFNFGAGNFTRPEHYLDHFPGTLNSHTYLGFHEYGWPTLFPAPGASTSAGLYRVCMEGIRARYGDRHRVLITEAGLTRMHQNPAAGDVGWLNGDQPLSEEQYWQSLTWYNGLLAQDGYVLGACLFEVGHHGDWSSFRHLGSDNAGQPIGLMERIAALNPRGLTALDPIAVETPPTPTYRLRGVVRAGGRPVAAATVRLIGGQETVGEVRGAVALLPGDVTWTRAASGLSGGLARCWRSQVEDEVAGISWAQFRTDATRYNPSLASSAGRLEPDQIYFLPENPHPPAEIVWDRPLTDFSGAPWACWRRYVAGKVAGLSYARFKRDITAHNPQLAETEGNFVAGRRYMLPRIAGQKEYVLLAETGRRGRFRFDHLPPGNYRLEVTADGFVPYTRSITLPADQALEVELEPVVAEATHGFAQFGPVQDFVRVHGTEFVAGGLPVRFIGLNIRGLVHYGDGRTLPATSDGHRREQVRAARDLGARVLRVFLPSEHATPQQAAERLASLIALVKEEAPGIYLLPALANLYRDVPFRVPGDDGFYERLDPNFGGELLNAAFFTGGYRQNYLPFIRHVVPLFRNEPVIFAWEIGNELKLNPVTGNPAGDPNVAAFIQFMLDTAAEIRRLDPNHLITTGMISTHHAWLHADELRRRLYAPPHFDFLTVHCYNDELHNDDSELARALGKPFIIEEAGYGQQFGPDRSGKVAEDMARWFGRGARGYMPWGFMATGQDIGDGDRDSGLDRQFHSDWDALTNLYRNRAHELAQIEPSWQPPVPTPVTPRPAPTPAGGGFSTGQTVFARDWVNIRRSAGHLNKLGDDIQGTLAPGSAAVITGAAVVADGLTWWPVQASLADGRTVEGWAAEAVPAGVLLSAQALAGFRATPRKRDREVVSAASSGTAGFAARAAIATLFTTTYVNLRRSPGYISKPNDDVLGQIPHGAAVETLAGPTDADGLRWWELRAPLLDNTVATGWAAEFDPNGRRLLAETPPAPPPTPAASTVFGPRFQPGDALRILNVANLRKSAGYTGQPADHVLATLSSGASGVVLGGPAAADGLEWWQLNCNDASHPAGAGWMALTAPDGVRLLAGAATAAALHVARPFEEPWPVTQGWGVAPDFYSQFKYDGVPLKGHNGLDFGTPEGTQLLAVDQGRVLKVDFEPNGFGHHLVIQHPWGESLYAHLARIDVGVGATLAARQHLGLSGNSGKSFGAHLHFGIRIYPYTRADGWGGFVNPVPHMQPNDLVFPNAFTHALVGLAPMAPELRGRPRP
jgi:murein DD-endopeptidase MepM/ murein hydrolase activator NlpD